MFSFLFLYNGVFFNHSWLDFLFFFFQFQFFFSCFKFLFFTLRKRINEMCVCVYYTILSFHYCCFVTVETHVSNFRPLQIFFSHFCHCTTTTTTTTITRIMKNEWGEYFWKKMKKNKQINSGFCLSGLCASVLRMEKSFSHFIFTLFLMLKYWKFFFVSSKYTRLV